MREFSKLGNTASKQLGSFLLKMVLFIMNKLFQVDFKFMTIDLVQIENGKVY